MNFLPLFQSYTHKNTKQNQKINEIVWYSLVYTVE